jgi:hypothetical protein
MPHRELIPRIDARATLNASIRTLYEDTLVPVREIARLAGVSARNIYALVRRHGCRPRGRSAARAGKRLAAATTRRAAAACRRAAHRQRKLAAVARAELKRHATELRAQRKREADARALALLAQALRELARLDARNLARAGAHAQAEAAEAAEAADLDQRRRALAIKIANLTRDASPLDPPAADAAAVQAPHQTAAARIRLLSD